MSTTSKQVMASFLSQLGRIEIDASTQTVSGTTATPQTSRLVSLKGASAQQAKSIFLTMHFLFPHELLPALDLLDRKLVNRHQCQSPTRPDQCMVVFYVQSASAVTDPGNRRMATSRFRNAWSATKVYYEVRLESWNCSCAGFAQAQLKLLLGSGDSRGAADDQTSGLMQVEVLQPELLFGGEATKTDATIPVCKHILAAAIGTAAPNLFNDSIQCKDMSMQEMAAWSAGWGEG